MPTLIFGSEGSSTDDALISFITTGCVLYLCGKDNYREYMVCYPNNKP